MEKKIQDQKYFLAGFLVLFTILLGWTLISDDSFRRSSDVIGLSNPIIKILLVSLLSFVAGLIFFGYYSAEKGAQNEQKLSTGVLHGLVCFGVTAILILLANLVCGSGGLSGAIILFIAVACLSLFLMLILPFAPKGAQTGAAHDALITENQNVSTPAGKGSSSSIAIVALIGIIIILVIGYSTGCNSKSNNHRADTAPAYNEQNNSAQPTPAPTYIPDAPAPTDPNAEIDANNPGLE